MFSWRIFRTFKKRNNKFYYSTFSGYNTKGAFDSGTIMMDRKNTNER